MNNRKLNIEIQAKREAIKEKDKEIINFLLHQANRALSVAFGASIDTIAKKRNRELVTLRYIVIDWLCKQTGMNHSRIAMAFSGFGKRNIIRYAPIQLADWLKYDPHTRDLYDKFNYQINEIQKQTNQIPMGNINDNRFDLHSIRNAYSCTAVGGNSSITLTNKHLSTMENLQIINDVASKCEALGKECLTKEMRFHYSISCSNNSTPNLYVSLDDKAGKHIFSKYISTLPSDDADKTLDEIRTLVNDSEAMKKHKIAELKKELAKLEGEK